MNQTELMFWLSPAQQLLVSLCTTQGGCSFHLSRDEGDGGQVAAACPSPTLSVQS